MSYNPDISAARREAKRHARETGASYQAALETIARRAGSECWSAFLADPRPLLQAEVGTTFGIDDPGGLPMSPENPHTHVSPRRSLIPRLTPAALVVVAIVLTMVFSNMLMEINASTGWRMQQERNAAPKMIFAGMPGFLGDRAYPYYVQESHDIGRRVTVIFLDTRTSPLDPTRLHGRLMSLVTSGEQRAIWSYLGTGLSRFVFHVDCRAGTIRLMRRENARWFLGPAGDVLPATTAKTIALTPAAMRELCSPDALRSVDRIQAALRE